MNISQQSPFPLIDNVIAYFWLFTNEEAAIEFALQNGVIYNQMRCENCEIDMYIYKDSSKGFGYKWICPKCHKSKSILFGSIFYSAKLPISKIFHLLYCWVYQISCSNTSREVGVNKNTVTYYFTLFRNASEILFISDTVRSPNSSKSIASLQSGVVPDITDEKNSACSTASASFVAVKK